MRLLSHLCYFLSLLTLTSVPAPVRAAAPAQEFGNSVGQLLFGLGIVIALLFATLWLLKRLTMPRGNAAGLLRIVAGTALGTRERVVILEIEDTWLVVGVAPGQITALAELPRGNSATTDTPTPNKDFTSRFRQILDRRHVA